MLNLLPCPAGDRTLSGGPFANHGIDMHDAKNRPIAKGDRVMIPCVVGNVDEPSGMLGCRALGDVPPKGQGFTAYAVNGRQVYRANEGDDTTIETATDDGKTLLR